MDKEILMSDRNTVRNEVFEVVASLTSSYTTEDLKPHWILGGGAFQKDSVGLDSFSIDNLRVSANRYIKGRRESLNRIPHKNPIEKSEIDGNTTLATLVDLIFNKIQF